MKIRLTDSRRLGELLSYLRSRGCIAYVRPQAPDTIDALLPRLSGRHESDAISALLDVWELRNPGEPVERFPG